MRSYGPRHTLAVLRKIAGLSQTDLAALVARSPRSIQAIEIGKLKLSEELAVRVSHETGVDVQWLLAAKLTVSPMTAVGGLPFTKAVYENTRASIAAGKNLNLLAIKAMEDGLPLDAGPLPLMRQAFDQISSLHHPNMDYWLASILSSIAAAVKVGQARLAIYRLAEFAKAIREEFGQEVDEDFTRDAAMIFENGLLRVKMAELALSENGPIPRLQPLAKEERTQWKDLLSDQQLRSGLQGLDTGLLWADLNKTGSRIKARRMAAQKTYETLVNQMQQVFSADKPTESIAKRQPSSKARGKKPRKLDTQ